ncbi:amino acid permease [Bombilactobacillus folatiphilus]|uniref:Amino acid permease n=1 Tax=Bombilactobacillus folatiphilus TaxID=2923362 RepID=A0ABY4P8D7_9LACO|nr:amino acid permease [Bombilactobacillus folatiphilus]UQS81958.1 amino acid permease [Bombilactobacillus folatiphilus]
MSIWKKMTQKADIQQYLQADQQFQKTMSAKELMALGIGAVIGTGIFIMPGTVAATVSGPAVILSFLLAAIVCATAAMCYAEFASSLPVAGSAYSYGNIIFGQFIGWVIGWALILEYMLAVATVSVGFSAYFSSFLRGFGIKLPQAISGAYDPSHGTYVNLVAIVVVLLIALMLSRGMSTSMKINDWMVIIKIAIIVLFVVVGCFYVKPKNWSPFLPFGWKGIQAGASTVFFAYLGFDAVSSSAPEVKNPQRNLPIGIIGTLVVATILYMAVSTVLTGMMPYTKLNVADPVSYALQFFHLNGVAGIISIGAMAGMFTMMVTMIYSSSRLVYAIGRDGLLPKFLGRVNDKHLPNHSLLVITIIIAVMGGLVDLNHLAELVNIGTLIAFAFVSIGVLPLRKRQDIPNKGFKVPLYPILPIISLLLCLYLMTTLKMITWISSLIWFAIGVVIYLVYGIRHAGQNLE